MGILSDRSFESKAKRYNSFETLKDNPEGAFLPNLTNYKYEFRHEEYFTEQLEISSQESKLLAKIPSSPVSQIIFPSIKKSTKIKVIIDTDLGTDFDDVMALIYALNIPNLEILGVTTNYVIPDLRAELTKKIINTFYEKKNEKKEIPVISGASLALGTHLEIFLAGNEGKPFYSEKEIKEHLKYKNIIYRKQTNASDFILNMIKKYPNEIKIISIGIPTNIGLAISSNKEIIPLINEIVIMGCGSFINKNRNGEKKIIENLKNGIKTTLYPNHNINGDTLATKIIFDSGIKIKIVAHEVTRCFWVQGKLIDYFRKEENNECIKVIGKLMNEWFNLRRQNGQCPHDPLTVHEAVNGSDNSPLIYLPGTLILHEWAAFSTFIPNRNGKHFLAVEVNEEKGKKFLEELENTIMN